MVITEECDIKSLYPAIMIGNKTYSVGKCVKVEKQFSKEEILGALLEDTGLETRGVGIGKDNIIVIAENREKVINYLKEIGYDKYLECRDFHTDWSFRNKHEVCNIYLSEYGEENLDNIIMMLRLQNRLHREYEYILKDI